MKRLYGRRRVCGCGRVSRVAVNALVAVLFSAVCMPQEAETREVVEGVISLPRAQKDGETSLEEALAARRSIRTYWDKALTLNEVGQLLWAAQGITDPEGFRTAPSAGATYPLEVYVVAGKVEGLSEGIYRYRPKGHLLVRVADGQFQDDLSEAALEQAVITRGAAVIAITGVYDRTAVKYGKRAQRYVHMEAGHAAQNVYLQAASLGLGTVSVGAFEDREVKRLLRLDANEHPLYLMPVGRPIGPTRANGDSH